MELVLPDGASPDFSSLRLFVISCSFSSKERPDAVLDLPSLGRFVASGARAVSSG